MAKSRKLTSNKTATTKIDSIALPKLMDETNVESVDFVQNNEITAVLNKDSVESMKKLMGNFDTCDECGIKGWIIDKNNAEIPVEIDVFIDGQLIIHTTADIFRQDLLDADIGNGKHGFDINIPSQYYDESLHEIEIKETNSGWILPSIFKEFCIRDYFDHKFYTEYYPDLKDFPYGQALNHYKTFGIKERRYGTEKSFLKDKKANINDLPKNFDAQTYLDLNQDLKNAGLNNYSAISHYLTNGLKENRRFKLDDRFLNVPVSGHGIVFNATSDVIRSHSHPELDNVMHIFDAYWHGIRSATACLPGHKVAISHKHFPSNEALAYLYTYIKAHKIQAVCYQAFSDHTLYIAEFLQREFDTTIRQYVVTHVSSAQFENHFEMKMLKKMMEGLKTGLFTRLGAVKPRFSGVIPEFWPNTLINSVPNIASFPVFRDLSRVLIPVENNWRKNLYTNVLAATHCESIKKVNIVNWPNEIEHIINIDKLEWLPFMKPIQMLAHSASCAAIMHSSLIECQPMTHLEGLAVGTPCITAKLGVHPIIDAHPLTQLCEVEFPDDVEALTKTLSTICHLWHDDPNSLHQMIQDHIRVRNELSVQSYLEFLA